MIDYLYMRHYTYDLLRRVFIEEPSLDLLTYLQNEGNLDVLGLSDNMNASTAPLVDQIKLYLSEKTFKQGEFDYENLHWDYTRLFIGPEAPPAPPWESFYTDDKLLFQQTTQDVKKVYTQNGYALGKHEFEAADHIGFELDFMYHLSGKCIDAIEENEETLEHSPPYLNTLETQHSFLHNHLLAFTDQFSKNVSEHSDTAFYKSFALLLSTFLKHDETVINQYIRGILS